MKKGVCIMYFKIGRVLFIWLWRVDALGAWGIALSKHQAKQRARERILAVCPDASEAALV